MKATPVLRGGDTPCFSQNLKMLPTFQGRVFELLSRKNGTKVLTLALQILFKPIFYAASLAGRVVVRCVPSTWLCSLFDKHPFSAHKFRAALLNFGNALSLGNLSPVVGELGQTLKAISAALAETREQEPRAAFSRVLHLIRTGLYSPEYAQYLRGQACEEVRDAAEQLNGLCYAHYQSPSATGCVNKMMEKYLEACGYSCEEEEEAVGLERHDGAFASARGMLRHLWRRVARLEEMPERFQVPIRWQSARKLLEHVNFNVDPQQDGNLPYPMMQVEVGHGEQSKLVTNIRMGTQTIQGWASQSDTVVEVVPEFLGFMRHLQSQGKRHLYVNLQDRNYPHHWKHEDDRCHTLEQCQTQVPGTLTVITLEKDSDFYMQEGIHEDCDDYLDFREELRRRLDDPNSGFFFPEKLREEIGDFSHKMITILDHIHEHLFESKESLDRRERQDLIEVFYVHLVEYLILTLDVSSFNLSCKNCIDRGGGANAMFLLYLAGRMGVPFDESLKRGGLNALVGPGLFVKGRLLRPERGHRLVSVLERLFESPRALGKLKLLELGLPHERTFRSIRAL